MKKQSLRSVEVITSDLPQQFKSKEVDKEITESAVQGFTAKYPCTAHNIFTHHVHSSAVMATILKLQRLP